VTDFSRAGSEHHLARIQRTLSCAVPGSVMVQLRDHDLALRRRFELGRTLRTLTRDQAQLFAVNDRLDLARMLDADAVHLGEASVSTADARAFGARFVSRSAHRLDVLAGFDADACLLSPIVEARHGRSALGLDTVARARVELAGRKLYALGGVTASNARACLAAGANGVAVVGAVLDSDEPEALVAALGIGR
jgi:thiamine-phosphate pyrophosphorylase